jgi:hypothetical protein
LRSSLVAFYGNPDSLPAVTDAEQKRLEKIRQRLTLLKATKDAR